MGSIHSSLEMQSCDFVSCAQGGLTALLWLSHVMIGFPALSYPMNFQLVLDGVSHAAQFHILDPLLKDKDITSVARAYEALRGCQDAAVNHLSFWLIHGHRANGAFQSTLGIGLWIIIFMLPLEHRAPVHFLLAYLQISIGLCEASIIWGGPFPDEVAKFGGSKPSRKQVSQRRSRVASHAQMLRPSKAIFGYTGS